jgi:adenylate cyclase
MNQSDGVLFEIERARRTRAVLRITSGPIAVPLYLLFWLADLIFAPSLAWKFLGIRVLVIPAMAVVYKLTNVVTSWVGLQVVALCATFFYAQIILVMMLMSNGGGSVYYAGLNLVCIGMIAFIPWRRTWLPWAVIAVYGPYFLACIHEVMFHENWKSVTLNVAFALGTISISSSVRVFQDVLEKKEFESRIELKNEIENRDEIIKQKAAEILKLNLLSRNFSPQVVDAVMNGSLEISTSVKRSDICSFFIDICDSTSKLMTLKESDFAASIEKFLDDVMRIAANFDATIDKFNGDQIVVFSNDPVAYEDYVERTVTMAFLIRKKIQESEPFFQRFWGGPMDVYIGIASGKANVGFYGNRKVMQSYTALGPPVNLAARLCSEAGKNEILVSSEVAKVIMKSERFEVTCKGKVSLHGFTTSIDYFSVEEVGAIFEEGVDLFENHACERCLSRMALVERKSIWIYRCTACGYELV